MVATSECFLMSQLETLEDTPIVFLMAECRILGFQVFQLFEATPSLLDG